MSHILKILHADRLRSDTFRIALWLRAAWLAENLQRRYSKTNLSDKRRGRGRFIGIVGIIDHCFDATGVGGIVANKKAYNWRVHQSIFDFNLNEASIKYQLGCRSSWNIAARSTQMFRDLMFCCKTKTVQGIC
jgi:hypothetical protein